MSNAKKVLIHEGKLFQAFEAGPWAGYETMRDQPDKDSKPSLSWRGGRISVALLYDQVYSFIKWVYDETKSEAQVHLYYNEDRKTWCAAVFPQEHGSGLTTKEIMDHADRAKEQSFITQGMLPCGSIHGHCDVPAFQSGGDHHDEVSRPGRMGLHITLGKMSTPEIDLHARVCWRGVFYSAKLSEWFDDPSFRIPVGAPSELIDLFLGWRMTHPNVVAFPERWKERLIKIERPAWKPTEGLSERRLGFFRDDDEYAGRMPPWQGQPASETKKEVHVVRSDSPLMRDVVDTFETIEDAMKDLVSLYDGDRDKAFKAVAEYMDMGHIDYHLWDDGSADEEEQKLLQGAVDPDDKERGYGGP